MKCEVVPQTRCEKMREQPAAPGFLSENGEPVVTAQRHKIDPASTIVLVFQPNLSGIEGHGGSVARRKAVRIIDYEYYRVGRSEREVSGRAKALHLQGQRQTRLQKRRAGLKSHTYKSTDKSMCKGHSERLPFPQRGRYSTTLFGAFTLITYN